MTLTAWWLAGLCAVLGAALLAAVWLLFRSRQRLRYIDSVLADIAAGHPHRRALTHPGDPAERICYRLNEMAVQNRDQAALYRREQAAGRELMVNLSHDVRTPLTTLLLYTEIVAGGKYHSQAQLAEYLTKIDTKARQIKQLSDNLFEYALVTRDTVVTLDRPASFSQIFEEPLAEFAEQLGQRGYGCLLDLGEEDVVLQVYRPYIRRIFDNIASNILKYADPAHPVQVCFVREGEQAGLAFANVPLPPESGGAESTKVGLVSVQTMMEKMQAEVRVSQTARRFCITLLFPVKPAKTE